MAFYHVIPSGRYKPLEQKGAPFRTSANGKNESSEVRASKGRSCHRRRSRWACGVNAAGGGRRKGDSLRKGQTGRRSHESVQRTRVSLRRWSHVLLVSADSRISVHAVRLAHAGLDRAAA